MKLILTQDVNGLGAPGDVVEVKDGYGRNYLLPRGLATAWTKGGEKQVAQIKRARDVREVRDLDSAQAIKSSLEGLKVKVAARAGDTGRLFGAITVGDVVAAVEAAGGPSVDKRKVTIVSPIKVTGSHKVEVRVHPEVLANLTVDVVSS
jgi:large subunit ribosomal protein L9